MNYRSLLLISATLVFIGIGFSLNKSFLLKKPQDGQELARKEAQRIFNECGSKRGEFCYSEKLSDFVKTHDLDLALKVLSALENVDQQVRGCHLIAHAITLAETSKNPEKWKDILAQVDSQSCSGGFIHGVIEAKSRLDSNFVLNETSIPELCFYVAETKGQGGEFNCAHIIGHILMAEENGNIPKAIEICGKVSEKLQYECFSGVFMENETRDNLVAHGIAQRLPWNKKTTEDQEKLCREYQGLAGQACWREISHMYAFISQDNPVSVFELCSRAQDELSRKECYSHGIGIMTASNRFDLGYMKDLCAPFFDDEQKLEGCFTHAINSLMYSSPKFTDRAIRLCSDIPDKQQQACFQKLGDALGTRVLQDERIDLCKGAPEKYKDICEGK